MVKDEGFAEAVVAIFDQLNLGDVVKDFFGAALPQAMGTL